MTTTIVPIDSVQLRIQSAASFHRFITDLTFEVRGLAASLRCFITDLTSEVRGEIAHVADPAQCGYIVRRHIVALGFAYLGITGLFLGVAELALLLFA